MGTFKEICLQNCPNSFCIIAKDVGRNTAALRSEPPMFGRLAQLLIKRLWESKKFFSIIARIFLYRRRITRFHQWCLEIFLRAWSNQNFLIWLHTFISSKNQFFYENTNSLCVHFRGHQKLGDSLILNKAVKRSLHVIGLWKKKSEAFVS